MLRRTCQAIMLAVLIVLVGQSGTRAQVVEEREGQSNPAGVVFKSVLYGVGTGLLIGGAYALVEDDDDVDTEDILKWSAAIGAAGGAGVGLIYVATRPEPKGDVEEYGAAEREEDDFRVAVQPGLTLNARQYRPNSGKVPLHLHLVQASF